MSLQEMIRALLAVGFTEEAIAAGVKVHKSTISRIFTGKICSPRCRIANRIEDIFFQYIVPNVSCSTYKGVEHQWIEYYSWPQLSPNVASISLPLHNVPLGDILN
jgi:hypothetical protein